jgi:hypothetical protein
MSTCQQLCSSGCQHSDVSPHAVFISSDLCLQEALSPDHPVGVVEVKDGEFSWDETQTKSTLKGVNFSAKPGSLTMVSLQESIL